MRLPFVAAVPPQSRHADDARRRARAAAALRDERRRDVRRQQHVPPGLVDAAGSRRLGRLDHAMIYALIAGTYAPIGLLVVHRGWRVPILATVWGGACLAAVVKLVWANAADLARAGDQRRPRLDRGARAPTDHRRASG